MPPPRHVRRKTAAKKDGGFWRGVFLLAFGFTGGVGASAYFAAYVNKLPIPLSEPPTRAANLPAEESQRRTRRETLEFHETLRRQRAAPAENTEPPPKEPPRRTVYYLQAGAFGRRDAADELRAQIALSGGRAVIRAGATGGADIFRVWTGPYPSEDAAEEARANLALQGYNNVQLLKFQEDPNEE